MLNLKDFWPYSLGDHEARLRILVFFSVLGSQWLDKTHVKSSREAYITASRFLRMAHSISRVSQFRHSPGGLGSLPQFVYRLEGILG